MKPLHKWVVLAVALLSTITWLTPIEAAPYEITEVRSYSLKQRDVVAVAIEERVSGEDVEDATQFGIEPAYKVKTIAGRVEVTVTNVKPKLRANPEYPGFSMEISGSNEVRLFLATAQPQTVSVGSVARKSVKARDGMIRMRTYLVFEMPKNPSVKAAGIVVIDPGHGGPDTGAVQNFIAEKDLNLDISLRAARLLERKGYDVYLTRTDDDGDVGLLDRADAANILRASLFISIHNNSLPEEKLYRSREFGTTVLYNAKAVRPAYDLAVAMRGDITSTLKTRSEVLQDRPRLVVLNSTWVPSVLAEVVMMPNPQNAKMISDRLYRQKAAEAIVKSADEYLTK